MRWRPNGEVNDEGFDVADLADRVSAVLVTPCRVHLYNLVLGSARRQRPSLRAPTSWLAASNRDSAFCLAASSFAVVSTSDTAASNAASVRECTTGMVTSKLVRLLAANVMAPHPVPCPQWSMLAESPTGDVQGTATLSGTCTNQARMNGSSSTGSDD